MATSDDPLTSRPAAPDALTPAHCAAEGGTARKQPGQQIGGRNAELEQQLRERTAALEAANQELEAFAYSVSHDLRAPLRSIRGFSEVLLEQHAEQLDGAGQDLLRRVCESSRRINRLVDDLLTLSRLGRSEVQRQSVNLTALAETMAARLRQAEPGREVQIIVQPDLRAEGDERLLGIVVEHLLGNAWKFTHNQPRALIEFGRTIQKECAFYVRDNGVGFDMAHAHKLFGVFQRLHSASDYPGNGIGLATVQRIVRRHGGRAWATGFVNQGATFYFNLPENRVFEL